MQIIIHAGMQKTGSTAIQNYLDVQRDALSGMGVTDPYFRHRSHHFIAKALANDPARFHRLAALNAEEDSLANATASLADLGGILRDPATRRLILSHEGFSVPAIARSLAGYLAEEAGPHADLTVVAYIRNPIDHYPSAVQNALRSANVRIAPPSRWRSTHPARAKELTTAFEDRVTLRLFSRATLKDGDVVADFGDVLAHRFAVTPPPPSPSANNSSLSGAACCLLYMANALAGQLPQRRHFELLRSHVASADRDGDRPRLAIPAEWRDELAAQNSAAWNQIAAQLDLPEDQRASATIQSPAHVVTPSTNRDLHDWLLTYFDPDFTEAVATRVAASGRPAAAAVAAWLREAPQLARGFVPEEAIFARPR